jgi:hypothetical protein
MIVFTVVVEASAAAIPSALPHSPALSPEGARAFAAPAVARVLK